MSTLTASEPLTKGITIARDMPSWGMPSLFVLTRCKAGGSGSFSPAPCTTRGPGLGDAQDSACPHEVKEKAASEFGVGYASPVPKATDLSDCLRRQRGSSTTGVRSSLLSDPSTLEGLAQRVTHENVRRMTPLKTAFIGSTSLGFASYYPGKKVSHPCTTNPTGAAIGCLRHSPRWL